MAYNIPEPPVLIGDIFPGNFINGLKLAFYQDNSSASLTAEELRNLILDGLKALKTNVDDLKEADRNDKDDYPLVILIPPKF